MEPVEQPPCKFCRIATGEEHSYKVFQNDETIAFLDIRPLFPGHLLLIPRRHVQSTNDLPSDLIEPLFHAAKFLAAALEEAMEAEGTFIAINNKISQSVPHLHLHIVPRRRGDGLKGFFWPRQSYQNDSAIKAVQRTIAHTVSRHKLAERGKRQ